jgi:hypothetical protein
VNVDIGMVDEDVEIGTECVGSCYYLAFGRRFYVADLWIAFSRPQSV